MVSCSPAAVRRPSTRGAWYANRVTAGCAAGSLSLAALRRVQGKVGGEEAGGSGSRPLAVPAAGETLPDNSTANRRCHLET